MSFDTADLISIKENGKGIPMSLAATITRTKMSKINILTESEIHKINNKPKLLKNITNKLTAKVLIKY